ncbi:MAG: lytic transglycosylase domain-containing protein [Methylocystaceae bacterium]|nr:lytic transglycosylase domain-containing protein [Methylocystaceae bacterium]
MKHITLVWLLALFMAAAILSTAEAASRFEIKQMVMSEASRSNVPVSLAMAVAKVESDFNARALSSAGARGVMQIMPATAQKEFGVHPDRLWNAETNIRLGVQFLEQLYDQYDGRWDLVLSHYNGGTVKSGRPHGFTVAYVNKVQKWQKIYSEQASLWEAIDESPIITASDDYKVADLQEWRTRDLEEPYIEDDFYEEDHYVDDWAETRIIIVERRDDWGWRHPPPPRGHFR